MNIAEGLGREVLNGFRAVRHEMSIETASLKKQLRRRGMFIRTFLSFGAIIVEAVWNYKYLAPNGAKIIMCHSLPYLTSIRRILVPAANSTSAVTIINPGIEIHAGVGSATTAKGPSDKGTGTSEFR